jgi:hypothetical protein
MKKKIETIPGFDIPKRELTKEEAEREITLERFQEWHHEVGEDFMDQVGYLFNAKVYGGYLMHKYPHKASELLKIINKGEMLDYQDTYENDEDGDQHYSDIAEFLNLTEIAKKNANQILIQLVEYYKG